MISTTAAPSPISAKTTVPPDVLATRELVKIYGGRAVVNGINVNVKAGEIVGLLGPNGAGKTTTFYMIVGLDRKSTRLNSSHVSISYAVFCLKKINKLK